MEDREKSLRLGVENYLKNNREAEEAIVAIEMDKEASNRRMEKLRILKIGWSRDVPSSMLENDKAARKPKPGGP